MTANVTGFFCVSVDCLEVHSIEAARQQRDLVELLEKTRVPSNWLLRGNSPKTLPSKAEITVSLPSSVSRSELLERLQEAKVQLAAYGQAVSTIAADPYLARSMWNLLVRRGCVVVRPRSTAIQDQRFQSIRGGLWLAPLSCSFVGGSRRSVRSLLKVCQHKVVDAAERGRLFHVNVEVGNARESWPEEVEALRALLFTGYEEKAKGRIDFARLSELPQLFVRHRAGRPMNSILRAA